MDDWDISFVLVASVLNLFKYGMTAVYLSKPWFFGLFFKVLIIGVCVF